MLNWLSQRASDWADAVLQAVAFVFVGAAIGIAQLHKSTDAPVPPRLMIARAVTSGGLGLSAGALLLFFPDAPLVAVVGGAAAFSSLGTSAIENIITRYLGGRCGGDRK